MKPVAQCNRTRVQKTTRRSAVRRSTATVSRREAQRASTEEGAPCLARRVARALMVIPRAVVARFPRTDVLAGRLPAVAGPARGHDGRRRLPPQRRPPGQPSKHDHWALVLLAIA